MLEDELLKCDELEKEDELIGDDNENALLEVAEEEGDDERGEELLMGDEYDGDERDELDIGKFLF
ncbi:MAG: hypothetical protein ACREHD_16125 [Pirellulales bacterium]